MADDKKPAAAAEKSAAATKKAANPRDVVEVKNISKRIINTSKGSIEAGKTGKATVAELRQLHRFLEKA